MNALQVFSASVRVKARALKKEKKKAEGLITQMLPKSVAENLKQNKSTSEMFDSATICFTEIEGFKTIARSCTPLQLFDILNTLSQSTYSDDNTICFWNDWKVSASRKIWVHMYVAQKAAVVVTRQCVKSHTSIKLI